jgi:hypothetical protein
MVRKNYILKKRLFWTQTINEFFVPIIFGVALGLMTRILLQKEERTDA